MSEKKEDIVVHHETLAAELDSDSGGPLPEKGSPERTLAERKIVRKLDARMLPMIFLIFIIMD